MARKRNNKNVAQTDTNSKIDCTSLYIRVSTQSQVTDGNGLAAQQEKLENYCKAMGWNVCAEHVYVDAGVSGKSSENRPQLQAMLQAAQDGKINRIVVTKFDRLARNTVDLMNMIDTLNKLDVALVLLDINVDTGTPTGRMIAGIMGQFAEWERHIIKERVTSGKKVAAKQGKFNGSASPIGYDYSNGEFNINQNEAYWVREIFKRFLGGASLNGIATQLNEAGAMTKNGSRWYQATVGYVLNNGAYAGLSQWDGVEAQEGVYPPIVSVDQYEAAQQRLASLKRGKPVKQS